VGVAAARQARSEDLLVLKEVSGSAASFTVLRYLVDAERDMAIPVAIVLSHQETGRLWFRLLYEDEQIAGASLGEMMPYLELARDQIAAWHRAGTLPYAHEALAPLSTAWWAQVRRLMQWRVRLDPTRPIDCRCAEEEIERLYEAWIRPSRTDKEHLVPERFPSEIEPHEPEKPSAPSPVSTGVSG
jgi:hypothetical protein